MVAISTVAAVVTIAGTAYSVSEQRKGKKANREIARRQQRQQALKAARSRRIAFRELQIKRSTSTSISSCSRFKWKLWCCRWFS